jgi:hypothetical protein
MLRLIQRVSLEEDADFMKLEFRNPQSEIRNAQPAIAFSTLIHYTTPRNDGAIV